MCCGRRICRWEETGGGLEEEECNELKMRVRKGLLDTAAVENVDKSGGGAYSPLRGGTGEFKSVEISKSIPLVSEILTDRYKQAVFSHSGSTYWDFESMCRSGGITDTVP